MLATRCWLLAGNTPVSSYPTVDRLAFLPWDPGVLLSNFLTWWSQENSPREYKLELGCISHILLVRATHKLISDSGGKEIENFFDRKRLRVSWHLWTSHQMVYSHSLPKLPTVQLPLAPPAVRLPLGAGRNHRRTDPHCFPRNTPGSPWVVWGDSLPMQTPTVLVSCPPCRGRWPSGVWFLPEKTHPLCPSAHGSTGHHVTFWRSLHNEITDVIKKKKKKKKVKLERRLLVNASSFPSCGYRPFLFILWFLKRGRVEKIWTNIQTHSAQRVCNCRPINILKRTEFVKDAPGASAFNHVANRLKE